MNKIFLIFATIPVFSFCSNIPPVEKYDGEYFKQFEERVDGDNTKEYSFFTLYDGEANRFELTFGYGLHFFYEIQITEYDMDDWYYSPNEGVFSEDYESITFTLDAKSKSELFPDGTYVLTHAWVYNKHTFTLTVNDEVFSLTTKKNNRPHYISSDLVGSFDYKVNNSIKFTLNVDVTSLADNRRVSVSLSEGDKNFTGSNIVYSTAYISFDVVGSSSGELIKTGSGKLEYKNEKYTFTNNRQSYSMTKKGDQGSTSYLNDPNNNSTFSNEHVSIKLGMLLGKDYRYLVLSELDEGGRQNMQVLFRFEDENESLINDQRANGNLIFTSGKQIKITHTLENENHKIRLFIDNELLYDNLVISEQ